MSNPLYVNHNATSAALLEVLHYRPLWRRRQHGDPRRRTPSIESLALSTQAGAS